MNEVLNSLYEWQLMGLCIEREAGGESYEGRVAVGTVILERADKKGWFGKTIREVILKKWQFSWTMKEAGQAYYKESIFIAANWNSEYGKRKSLRECCDIALKMVSGEIPRDPDLVGCYNYLNPEVAAKTKADWLSHGMKAVKVIGKHEFFI
jgi:hypothetical protein